MALDFVEKLPAREVMFAAIDGARRVLVAPARLARTLVPG